MDDRRKGEKGGGERGKKYDRRKQFETVAVANRERRMGREKGNCIQWGFHRRLDRVSSGCTGGSGARNNKNGTGPLGEQS